MHDHEKTKSQLIQELADLRAELESVKRDRRQTQEDLGRVMDLSPVLLCTAGFDGYFKQVNAAFGKILGYSEEELLSRPAFEIVHPDDRATSKEHLEKLSKGGLPVNIENRNLCKDGSCRSLIWTVVSLPEKGIVYGIGHDITERKQAEAALQEAHQELERRVTRRTAELAEANERLVWEVRERKRAEETLRENEERYRSLVETTTDLIFEIDLDGVYTYVNSKAKDLTGYEPEELIGKTIFEFLPRDEGKRIAEIIWEKATEGESVSKIEIERLHKTGRAIVSETSGVPIFDSKGKCCGFRGISRDVTQRKKAEEAIRKEQQHLRRSLEASDQERKLIAYEIHDGLTQHLTAAVMQFQTFSRLQSRKPLEAAKVFDTGMQMLGHSLSEARRLISGVRPPLLDEVGVLAAVESLIYETASRETEIRIEFHHKVEFARLAPALENALYRIVQESLANACRHSKSEKARIEILQIGDHVRVEVRDWGVGFAPQSVDEGCYGLAGIRERARVLGGRATIDSTPGEGTRVTVELPLMENQLDSPPHGSSTDQLDRP